MSSKFSESLVSHMFDFMCLPALAVSMFSFHSKVGMPTTFTSKHHSHLYLFMLENSMCLNGYLLIFPCFFFASCFAHIVILYYFPAHNVSLAILNYKQHLDTILISIMLNKLSSLYFIDCS